MLDLHYWPTPNGKKVTIQLEECGIPYNIVQCNIGKGDQFDSSFLDICPNNRMPALVDHEPKDGGEPISVFESGAIMLYIAEKTGQFMPEDIRGRYEVTQWLIWQMANQGPKTGECGHFRRLGDSQGISFFIITIFFLWPEHVLDFIQHFELGSTGPSKEPFKRPNDFLNQFSLLLSLEVLRVRNFFFYHITDYICFFKGVEKYDIFKRICLNMMECSMNKEDRNHIVHDHED